MKIDMANFALSRNRSAIEQYSSKFEFEEFMKLVELEKGSIIYLFFQFKKFFHQTFSDAAVQSTKHWLKYSTEHYLKVKFSENLNSETLPIELKRSDHIEILIQLYLILLETPEIPDNVEFPETLKLDQQRIRALGEKYLQLILTMSAIFIAGNLAGKSVCESFDFKSTLKTEIIVILNDVSFE